MRQPGKCSNVGVRNVAGILAGLLLLVPRLGGAGPAAANTTTGNEWSGWDPGTVVEINLERGRITESLPFDVPFYLLSKPPEPLVPKLDPVAFLTSSPRSAPACDENQLPNEFCGPYPTARCRVPVAKVKEKVNNTGDPVDQIEISMPQLEPKMDYCVGVAMPRQASADEKKLMQKAARDYLDIAVKAASDRQQVLTADWLARECTKIKAAIESELRKKYPTLTLIPSQESVLQDCQVTAVTVLYGKLVSNTSLDNLKGSLGSADAVLTALKDAIPDNETDPRLKAIRDFTGPEERLQYLISSPELPRLISKEQVDRWAEDAKARQEELKKGWGDTEKTDTRDICNDSAKTKAASPLMRMRCFAASELEGVILDLGSLAVSLSGGDDIDSLAASVAPLIAEKLAVGATTWAKFEQRFRWYVSADLGFAHAWDIDESFAYIGVNFYGSPVNKKAPLNGFGRRLPFLRRFALVIGLPMTNLEDPSRKPLVAGKPVLVGAGIRLTDYLRLTVGGLLFNEADPDPLVDDTRGVKATPFASLSLDIDVAGIFTSFFAPR